MRHDPVNHPRHYTGHPSGVECIVVTEHMNFCLGNAVKYIWRAGEKGDQVEDLRKARWYLDREIGRLTGTQAEQSHASLSALLTAERDALRSELSAARHALANERQKVEGLQRQIRFLSDQLDDVRAELHAAAKPSVPASFENLLTLESALAEGSDDIPADDETADMGDGADAPWFDPLIPESEVLTVIENTDGWAAKPEPRPAPTNRFDPADRQVTLDGRTFITSPAIGRLINRLDRSAATAAELIAEGFAGGDNHMHAAVSKAKRVLVSATKGAWTIQARPTEAKGEGRPPVVYTLGRAIEKATGEGQPSAQSAGDAGASPDHAAAAMGGPVRLSTCSQVAPCVTPPEMGEGAPTSDDPAPAADDAPIHVQPPPILPGDARHSAQPLADGAIEIPDGVLIGVCVKTRRIATPKGVYRVEGTPLARALDWLAKARDGQMFDVQTLAAKAGYKDAAAARAAIQFEEARLRRHGIAVAWLGRDNLRLMEAAAS